MNYFKDKIQFEKEMMSFKAVLDVKGYVLESDHVYAYAMQYGEAFEEVKSWLEEQGYQGDLKSIGTTYDNLAVYGLYDSKRIIFKEILEKLLDEAKSQL